VAAADCVMIVTDHTAVDYRMIKRHARLVVDTRNAMPKNAMPISSLHIPMRPGSAVLTKT
ncbi:MAG: hypothetical protein V4623_10160, partial [Pseudomonadota bacterium]